VATGLGFAFGAGFGFGFRALCAFERLGACLGVGFFGGAGAEAGRCARLAASVGFAEPGMSSSARDTTATSATTEQPKTTVARRWLENES
jgi:hypothetical protein